MPSGDYSAQLGTIAEIISNNRDKKIAIAGSTDLTHYGRDYGFTPAGEGENGIKWAKDVNDKAIIKNIEEMDSKGVVETARSSASACGPYAVAATITLCKKLGANKVTTLNHTHSSEIMTEKFGSISSSSVGYAGIIFSKEN
jgi:AmmeMemoRadiSam system protein B